MRLPADEPLQHPSLILLSEQIVKLEHQMNTVLVLSGVNLVANALTVVMALLIVG